MLRVIKNICDITSSFQIEGILKQTEVVSKQKEFE